MLSCHVMIVFVLCAKKAIIYKYILAQLLTLSMKNENMSCLELERSPRTEGKGGGGVALIPNIFLEKWRFLTMC